MRNDDVTLWNSIMVCRWPIYSLEAPSGASFNLRSGSPFPSEKFVQRNSREKRDSGKGEALLPLASVIFFFAGGEGEGGLIAG